MIHERTELLENIDHIYRDIVAIKIDGKDSFNSLLKKFYDVMRKWGICQGTWTDNGRSCNNAEWNMCYTIFQQHINLELTWYGLLNEPPKDLLAYGKEPKK